MKNILLTKLFLITCIYVHAQPTIQWQKCIGGSWTDNAYAVQLTHDGGYIIAGDTKSINGDIQVSHTEDEILVIKLNNSGVIQWVNTYGGSGIDRAQDVVPTSDGGYVIAGTSASNDGDITMSYGDDDYWIFKVDSIGNIVWEHSFGDVGHEYAASIRQTADGGFIIAGYSYSTFGMVTGNHTGGGSDYWIVKLDAQGILEWQKCLGGSVNDLAREIREIPGGGYIVVGVAISDDGDISFPLDNGDYWLVKLDNLGSLVWEKTFGGTMLDDPWALDIANDGGFIIAGDTRSTDGDVTGNHGMKDIWVVKTDQNGTMEWQKSFGGTGMDAGRSVDASSDGGFIVVGTTQSGLSIIKMDSLGTLQWQMNINGGIPFSIQETAIGEYIVCGNNYLDSIAGNHGGADAWIIKLSTTVNVNDIENSISEFSVSPNPFSSETKISFNLLREENTVIEIHDIHGRIIKNIPAENLNRGINKFVWDVTGNDGAKIESGVYFITIRAGEFKNTKKVIVMK